jgi:catechol 2,3-dioxygenase-like lactoylglutathione lyase family enzyme
MKFEIVVVPVSDVDRAKQFYGGLGWRLNADFGNDDDLRVIQFTPPSSGCSVIFGKNVTAAAPGSAQGLYLIVSDIAAARADLVSRGVEVSEVIHDARGVYAGPDEPYLFGRRRVSDPGPRAYQLPFLRFVQRSGWQWLALSGDHHPAAGSRGGGDHLRFTGRACGRAAPRRGGAWRAREAPRLAR